MEITYFETCFYVSIFIFRGKARLILVFDIVMPDLGLRYKI